MADLIDRDALMKKICGNECGSICDEECENAACNFYDYIMDAPAVNRWIPCSERLPETDVDVIAYYPFWYDNMYQNTGIVVAKLCFDRLTWDIVGEFNPGLSAITHWMPLPEPPEVYKQ